MVSKERFSNFHSHDKQKEEVDDDDDDTLSFCDLPILANDDQENDISITRKISSPSPEDPFEFFNNLLFQEPCPATPRVIISKQQEPIVKLSSSSSSSSSSNSNRRNSSPYYNKNIYSSSSSSSSSSRLFTSISNVEKVNITSLTSMSSKSRKMMFMFGPVRFNNEMGLSSIKMRQSKRAIKDKFVSQAAAATIAGGGRSRQWGLLRSLSRYTSRATVDSSASSCGCFS